jgi:AcrR family transcriptional regulator
MNGRQKREAPSGTSTLDSAISDRLLDTAVDHFGRCGFDGVSTRDIARASGTAMSSITYYFGGKEGLYLAAADHIAKKIRELQAPGLEIAHYSAAETPDQAIAITTRLLDGFAEVMLCQESVAWSQFIVREQQRPTEAFERLYDGFIWSMVSTVMSLIAIARPDFSATQTKAMAAMLFGQVLVLRVGQATICRVFETEELTTEIQDLLRAQMRANIATLLSAPTLLSETVQ